MNYLDLAKGRVGTAIALKNSNKSFKESEEEKAITRNSLPWEHISLYKGHM